MEGREREALTEEALSFENRFQARCPDAPRGKKEKDHSGLLLEEGRNAENQKGTVVLLVRGGGERSHVTIGGVEQFHLHSRLVRWGGALFSYLGKRKKKKLLLVASHAMWGEGF